MRVGVVGAGAAGLVTSWLLQNEHEMTVLEASPHLGGHAHTRHLRVAGQNVPCETGLRFIFDHNYPVLHALFRSLGLRPGWRPVDVTLVWPRLQRSLVLPPRTAAHWARLARPENLGVALGFHAHMVRLRRMGPGDAARTIGAWGAASALTARHFETVFLPFLAASWGAPVEEMRGFPAAGVGKVLQRPAGPHGIFEFPGGVSEYIDALCAAQPGVTLRPSSPVVSARRQDGGWRVTLASGEVAAFDQLVFATAAWDAAKILADEPAAAGWVDTLRRVRHFDTTIAFHEDETFMPPDPGDWSTLNQFHDPERPWTTEWAGQSRGVGIFRTWVPAHRPPPRREHHRVTFKHLVLTLEQADIQRALAAAQGDAGVSVVGLYVMDVDNHESAVMSAIPVGRRLSPRSPTLARLDAELAAGGTASPATPHGVPQPVRLPGRWSVPQPHVPWST
jgi:predicted NAD/FAD-binding protein